MKKLVLVSMLLCSFLAFAGAAFATEYKINAGTINVGSIDQLLGETKLNNSDPGTELAWVKSILKDDNIVFTTRLENNSSDYDPMIWVVTDTLGVYALDLGDTPDWFLVKTGKIDKTDLYREFLFENTGSLSYAVVALAEMGIEISNITKISHVSEFDGDNTPVPEPGTMVLLGVGMLGLAIFGKRRMNRE